MKIAVSQSNFLPWPGYFSLIKSVETFYFYDVVQFTRRDWRAKNFIKGSNGKILVAIPVKKTKQNTKINEIELSVTFDIDNFEKTLFFNYKKSPNYNEITKLVLDEMGKNYRLLSELNHALIRKICDYLEIKTKIDQVTTLDLDVDKNNKLINICKTANACIYLSGPKAKFYIDENEFLTHDIKVEWMQYPNYRYNQLWGEFIPNLSVIDLLYNLGKKSKYLL